MCQRRDIVEDIGPRRRGAAHHLGLARIDGDQRAGARAQALDHRDDAGELVGNRHVAGAGARRLATDIDDVGALVCEPQRVIDRSLHR